MADSEEDPSSFCLSSSFGPIVSKVLETADRSDSGNNNLRSSAYEALMDLIKYSAKVSTTRAQLPVNECSLFQDCYSVVVDTMAVLLGKFDQLLAISVRGGWC